jgi:cytochrome c oxidase subunit 2
MESAPGFWGDLGQTPTTIFSAVSTPAREVRELSLLVLAIAAAIFLTVGGLLLYALVKYRGRPEEDTEPAQVFGSTQIELAWTIIPILIIVVLFLGTARVIFAVQDTPKPPDALDVTVVGHQFWWEFRYPEYGVTTANELHVPLSDPKHPTPTYLKLTSADVMHSFWVPKLSGKTDLLPNRVNEMWVDPHETGVFEGQCAQFCGTQHARMLLRVYVDTPAAFAQWIANQQRSQPAPAQSALAQPATLPPPPTADTTGALTAASQPVTPLEGRQVFEQQSCINCHTVAGTVANGRYGPDLTHLMSRDTIAAGALTNTQANLQAWIANPDKYKPGSLMPAMHLTGKQNAQIAAYLATLH